MAIFGSMGKKPKFGGEFDTPLGMPQYPNGGTPPIVPASRGTYEHDFPMGQPQQPKDKGFSTIQRIGAALAAFGGNMGPAQLMMQDRMFQRRAEMERQQQEAERYAPQKLGDSIIRLNPQTGQYEAVYSAPQKSDPTAIQRNYEYLKTVDPALADKYIRNQGEGSPIVANNGDGTFQIIPRSMVQGQPQMAPQRPAIGDVIPDPRKKGGAGPSVPRSFP